MTQKTALQAIVAHIEENTSLYSPIRLNRLDERGISVQLISGGNESKYLSGGVLQELSLLFLAKSSDQNEPLDALSEIEEAMKTLPTGIERSKLKSSPALVCGGENEYIYEMQITAAFYKERN